MRVLVTRPLEQAARTARKLEKLGHEAVIAPALEIAPTGAALPSGDYDLVLATSAQAFSTQQIPASLTSLPLTCVGEKTAEAARAAGFVIIRVAPDSEALADRLVAEGGEKSALYLAGRERRDVLERRLRAARWRVEIVETYEARPVASWPEPVSAALARGEVEAMLHSSPRSAEVALGLAGPEIARSLLHFCLSPAVAAVCRGWAPEEKIFAASQPGEDSLLTLVQTRQSPARR